MEHTWLIYEKQRFIEYILYQYEFKNAESVWILNLIKSNPKYLSNISFAKEMTDDRFLSISTKQSNQLSLMYCKEKFCIDDGRQIFHDIRLDQSHLNVILYLNQRDDRLNRIMLLQMLFDQFSDNENVNFSKDNPKEYSIYHWEQLIRNEIDRALDNNDHETFLEMTKILQFINELEENW